MSPTAHPRRRILRAAELPAAGDLRERYHVALLQGFLLRADHVSVWIREYVRAVVRYAKLQRLLCSCARDGDATRIDLSGPLALFHETLKYGRALARFVPTVAGTPAWRLEARCRVDEGRAEPIRLLVDATAPLPRTHALPRDSDSKLEAALARALRRLGTPWTIAREPSAVPIGGAVFFPDFALTRGRERVLVEIVGFWSPEYLASKLKTLAHVKEPLVVAVDVAHGDVSPVLGAAEVVAFSKRVDPTAILAAAERALARRERGGLDPSCEKDASALKRS